MKYKLVHEFPGSGKVGSIYNKSITGRDYFTYGPYIWIPTVYIENSPEYFVPFLFITEDGEDVFKEDKVYKVVADTIIREEAHAYNSAIKYFYTEEKAKEYLNTLSEFKVGEWLYRKLGNEEFIGRFNEKISNTAFKVEEVYSTKDFSCESVIWYTNFGPVTKATDEQIERVLIAVAKHKGFKKGAKFRSIVTESIQSCYSYFSYDSSVGLYTLDDITAFINIIYYTNTRKWAEIISGPEKYVLLKDLPNHKAGTICQQGFKSNTTSEVLNTARIYPIVDNTLHLECVCLLRDITKETFNEWFKKID